MNTDGSVGCDFATKSSIQEAVGYSGSTALLAAAVAAFTAEQMSDSVSLLGCACTKAGCCSIAAVSLARATLPFLLLLPLSFVLSALFAVAGRLSLC